MTDGDRRRTTGSGERQRIAALERRVALVEHRERVATWKLQSLVRRRWWRLGRALARLRRRPLALPSVVMEIIAIVRDGSAAAPRPVPPTEATEATDEAPPSDHVPTGGAGDPRPRRRASAVGLVDASVAAMLRHEFRYGDIDREDPLSTLRAVRPDVVVVDRGAAAGWDPQRLAAVRSEAERLGADLLEVDLGAGAGLVHPRVHGPVLHRPRRSAIAAVDVARRLVDGAHHADDHRFFDAVKAHTVVTVTGASTDAELAPLAATATMLLADATDDDGPSGRFAMTVDGDQERDLAARALTRSGSFTAKRAHVAMRRAIRDHDIGRRLGTDLTPVVDVMVATNRPHRLADLMANVGRQTYPSARLFLIGHGIRLDPAEVAGLADEHGVELAGVWHEAQDVVLGEVFNRGFRRTGSRLVAKMDDDDYYGPEYLWDLVSAKDAAAADVAGKWAHFVHLAGTDATLLRFADHEHRYRDVVAISTLLMDRDVLEDEQFPAMPYGSGSVFLRAIGARGATVFAADRWNYLYRRSRDGDENTFPESDLRMLASSTVVCSGVAMAEVIA